MYRTGSEESPSEWPSPADLLLWGMDHARDNPGHRTVETITEPARCITCGERSPAWNIRERLVEPSRRIRDL